MVVASPANSLRSSAKCLWAGSRPARLALSMLSFVGPGSGGVWKTDALLFSAKSISNLFPASTQRSTGDGNTMELDAAALPEWASKPCIMGIDEAGRGPVLGPMVYGCMFCARSYQKNLSALNFADSKTLTEKKREELFDSLKVDNSIGWAVDIIDPRELSAKMLKKSKISLNEISHDSAIGLIRKISSQGVLLTEVYLDTVGDADKYAAKLSAIFTDIKFVVSKKADSLYPIVSGASIVAKVTRDRALRNWELEETAVDLHRNFGSGYPGDPQTKAWLSDHTHPVFGFPALVRFSWGTCTSYSKSLVEVQWEGDTAEEDGDGAGRKSKRQMKLVNVDGVAAVKRKSEEDSRPSRCKFFQARKLQLLPMF